MAKEKKYSEADRRHLREQAKRQGIEVRRGAAAEDIDKALKDRFSEDYDAISRGVRIISGKAGRAN